MYIIVKQTVLGDDKPFEHRVLFEKNALYGIENLTRSFDKDTLQPFFVALVTQKEGSIIAPNGDTITWKREQDASE